MAITNNKLADLGANIEANGVFRFTNDSDAETPKTVQRWHYLQILKHPQLKYRVLIYSIIRFLASLTSWTSFYVLFIQNQSQGSISVKMSLASIAEIIGGILLLMFLNLKPDMIKKLPQIGFLGVFVPSLFFFVIYTSGVCQENCYMFFFQVGIAFSLIMKIWQSWTRGWIYHRANELFPVEVRSQCNGIGEIFAQSAGPLIPVIFKLGEEDWRKEDYSIPWLIVSIAAVACFGLSFLLPTEDLTTLEKAAEIELNLDDNNPRMDSQPLTP